MSDIIDMIKKEQYGIVLVNGKLAICYNGKEFHKESSDQEFEEFILSVTDVSGVSVRNHMLDDGVAVMIIGDLKQTIEEYFVLFCMFHMALLKPDDETISSLLDIDLEEHEILDELSSTTLKPLDNISNKQEMFQILEKSIFEIIERQFFDEEKKPSAIFLPIIEKRNTIRLRGIPSKNNHSKDETLKKQLQEVISKTKYKQDYYYDLFEKLKKFDISTSEKFEKIIQILKKIQVFSVNTRLNF